MKTDSADTSIFSHLETDDRTANREIAEQFDVSEGTDRNRIARLMKNEYYLRKGADTPGQESRLPVRFPESQSVVFAFILPPNRPVTDISSTCSSCLVSSRECCRTTRSRFTKEYYRRYRQRVIDRGLCSSPCSGLMRKRLLPAV